MEGSDGSQESSELTAGPKAKSHPKFLSLQLLTLTGLLEKIVYTGTLLPQLNFREQSPQGSQW